MCYRGSENRSLRPGVHVYNQTCLRAGSETYGSPKPRLDLPTAILGKAVCQEERKVDTWMCGAVSSQTRRLLLLTRMISDFCRSLGRKTRSPGPRTEHWPVRATLGMSPASAGSHITSRHLRAATRDLACWCAWSRLTRFSKVISLSVCPSPS